MLYFVDSPNATHHKGRQHGLQVSANRKQLVIRPDHQALVTFLGHINTKRQALSNIRADRVHFCFDAGDQHVIVQRPQTHSVVFVQRRAGGVE